MSINYDKWNKLDDYSSDENEESGIPKVQSMSAGETGKLITIPWDTTCEKVRWALDRYTTKYVEYGYPFPLNIWFTIDKYSEIPPNPQHTSVPIFEFDKNVYKRDSTEIFTFLYSRAFGSTLRIYSSTDALTHEQYFDKTLAPASKAIYYSMVLPSGKLCEELIFGSIHLATWRTLYRLFWPFTRRNMMNYFKVNNKKTQEENWRKVDEAFAYADNLLAENPDGGYLVGKSLTAADITFAAHAIPILCPNEDEFIWFNGNSIGIKCPSKKDLPEDLKKRVEAYRNRPSGVFAMQMYKKERGKSHGSKPSRYAKENTPWWAQEFSLRRVVYGLLILIILLGWIFILSNPWYVSIIVYVILSIVLIQFVVKPFKESKYGQRISRIMFYMLGNGNNQQHKSCCEGCQHDHDHDHDHKQEHDHDHEHKH